MSAITEPGTSHLGPLVETRRLGRWTVHAIQAGGQKLDGGAMFGVVPKMLWQRRIVPDERNRIQLGMRCLLIEHEIGPVLIDTGAGNKENEKFYDIYGIENAGRPGGGPTALEDGLAQLGVTPADVVMVSIDCRMAATAANEPFSAARSAKSAGEKLSGLPAGSLS